MSDVEELVGTEIRSLAGRPQPASVPDMLRRVRRARRRAAIVGAATVALLVTAASASVWAVARRDPSPPTVARPSGLTARSLFDVYFVDADHGFVLACRCPRGEQRSSEMWLMSTSDGGQTWQRHPLPEGASVFPLTLQVFDRDRLLVGPFRPETDAFSYFSEDRGQTWDIRLSQPDGRVAEVPPLAGVWVLMRKNLPAEIFITRPDGTMALLENVPNEPIPSGDPAVRRATDGSLWIVGQGIVFTSPDRGRTWMRVRLPEVIGNDLALETYDGRHVYLANRFGLDGYQLWRSADGAKSWEPVQVPAQVNTAPNIAVVNYALPDGGLAIGDYRTGIEFRLAAGANRFGAGRQGLAYGMRGARYVRSKGDPYQGNPPYHHSADGKNWTELRLE